MSKTMFAITKVDKNGMRTLAFANQGRNHYETREQAEAALYIFQTSPTADVFQALNPQAEVRKVDCYDHGDAKTVWFD